MGVLVALLISAKHRMVKGRSSYFDVHSGLYTLVAYKVAREIDRRFDGQEITG